MIGRNIEARKYYRVLGEIRASCRADNTAHTLELLAGAQNSNGRWTVPKFSAAWSWLFNKMSWIHKAIDEEESITGYEKAKEVAIDTALRYGHEETALAILSLGLDRTHTMPNLVFNHAVDRNSIPIVQKMIDLGFDVSFFEDTRFADKLVFSALETAAFHGSRELVDLLLSAGAHPTVMALSIASSTGNVDAVRTFLRLGISATVRDRQGLTPIEQARRSRTVRNKDQVLALLSGRP